ncbi:MAG: 30S ribosomal protein S3 [Leptonema sp. (in: bacteria)]
MGQKVNPIGLRIGINKTWDSIWYESDRYRDYLVEDLSLKEFIHSYYPKGTIVKIIIKRLMEKINVTIETAKPGVVIGPKGLKIEALKKEIKDKFNKIVNIYIEEKKKPETIAKIIADTIADQIEKRMPYKRTMKQAIRSAMRNNVQGIKVMVSGRLNGVDMARTEFYKEGRIPLHTLRADIDYAVSEAETTYGIIGIKVWVYKGDILPVKN